MLAALKFVQGAVAKKTHAPILKHFQIKDSRIQSHNGVLSLSAPIECDLTIQPVAATFVHAISLCKKTVALHQTETGRLAVTSGNFKAYIETSTEEFPAVEPRGTPLQVTGLLQAVKTLAPVMGEDPLRPWAQGILFAGNSAFATNNIMLVEHWFKHAVDQPFGLPAVAVNELLRIDEEPESIQITPQRVTFHFSDGRWLATSLLLISQWPDVRKLLPNKNDDELQPLDETFFEALKKLRPFTKDMRPVWLNDSTISTAKEDESGAHLTTTECTGMRGMWALDQLAKLQHVATHVAWGHYPKLCPFFGAATRGVMVGMQ